MRLSKKEIKIIKEVVYEYFGEKSEIYIFGSRLDNSKVGRDIDIMVKPQKYFVSNRLLIKAKLKQKLFKPVDLIIYRNGKTEIEKEGLKGIRI